MLHVSRSGQIDLAIADCASRQRGLVTRTQLRALGISDRSIRLRVTHGKLTVVHPGVYAVGNGPRDPLARQLAALLAVGPAGAISHLTAAQEWRISRIAPTRVDIVLPRSHRGGLTGVAVHRTRALPASHVVVRNNMRRTTVTRTLLDLADELTPWQLANLMNEARFRRRLDTAAVRDVCDTHHMRAGILALRKALALHLAGSAGTKSDAEDYVLSLLLGAGFIEPHVNVHMAVGSDASYELDFSWPQALVNVEVDGSGHGQPSRQLADELRDRALLAAGWTIVRVDPEHAAHRPDVVIDEISSALNSASCCQRATK